MAENASANVWLQLFELWKKDPLARRRLWACKLAERFGAAELREDILVLADDKGGHVRKPANKALAKPHGK